MTEPVSLHRVVRRVRHPRTAAPPELETLVTREWLVTNGLGGYASGSVAGLATRRYHGILVAALPNPLGRMVMLNHLAERLLLPDGTAAQLTGDERVGAGLRIPGAEFLAEFRLEAGLPVWEYRIGNHVLEKRVVMPHLQNTVYLSYRLVAGDGPARIELTPAIHFRKYEGRVNEPLYDGYRLAIAEGHYVIAGERELPPLHIALAGADVAFTVQEHRASELLYRVEQARGYEFEGALWSPGCFRIELSRAHAATLVASTESLEVMTAMTGDEAWGAELERRRRLLEAAPPPARDGVGAELVLAADQFVVTPAGRRADTARARAVGDEVRTIIAGYHWFTDWGRDTMISLEGLTLVTGRHREAGAILRAFAQHARDGLIPNMFPDGSDLGLYHTADATLWFFHAVDRYVAATGNRGMLDLLLPVLVQIFERHRDGTRFGIGMDPADGLIRQGAEGYQLTWMDAKVDDWVVTPRRGKAVEINALWYNALRLLSAWLRDAGRATESAQVAALADRVHASFNERFWYDDGGYLYDVIDGPNGDSIELRPNQVFALSLPNEVLDRTRWARVLEVVERHLLTPVGLRSLAPGSPDYKSRYFGDLRARDAAYHQGTVWGWLIGPWVDAWLKLHPGEVATARGFLQGLIDDLDEFGVGTIAEVFDAEAPFTARGCIAQAWSVAEALRCWVRTSGGGEGARDTPTGE